MKAIALALVMVSSLASAAGFKAEWKLRAYQGISTAAAPAALVASWDYSARKTDQGVLNQLSSGMWELKGHNLTGEISARLSVTATDVRGDSATLRVQVWDTSGLPENSPRYRGFFQTDAPLKGGEGMPILFTIGDASVSGASARYQLVVSLDSLTKEP